MPGQERRVKLTARQITGATANCSYRALHERESDYTSLFATFPPGSTLPKGVNERGPRPNIIGPDRAFHQAQISQRPPGHVVQRR